MRRSWPTPAQPGESAPLLMGLTARMISGGADKEVDLGARVGLLYAVYL
jgi:hypothetical protein